jgi:thiol-disulfide isomerase/thioredoxin
MKIKRPKRKTLMQFTLVILAIFLIRSYQQQDLTTGNVPSFSSQTLSGDIMSSNPLPNQAILIHFWATWCPICSLENANIQTLSEDYKVLNIAMQSGSDLEVETYAQENQMRLDNLINDQSGSIARLFGVKATPSSFIVNPQGQIQFSEIGYVTTLGYRLRLWWAGL